MITFLDIVIIWLSIGFIQWVLKLNKFLEINLLNALFWLLVYFVLGPFAFLTNYLGIL